MSIRNCFAGKIEAGTVAADAGARILGTLDEVLRERHGKHAAMLAAAIAKDEARRKADLYYGQTIAQAGILKAFWNYNQAIADLRETPGVLGIGNKAPPSLGKNTQSTIGFALRSLLARDPWEIATWGNVAAVARELRGEAHRVFADAIEFLRPKGLGFRPEATRELDILRQAFGAAAAEPQSAAVWKAWGQVNEKMAQDFIAAGGDLKVRPDYMPNPTFDPSKVKALGEDRFKALVRENVDRARMIDFRTDQPMTNGRFERLLDDAWRNIIGFGEGIPSAGGGSVSLANGRAAPRLFQWKGAEAWMTIAETVGDHASPYEAMLNHIESVTNDTAMMRILGPNPDATRRFALDLMSREAARIKVTAASAKPADLAKATRANRIIEARINLERRMFESLYDEVSGLNRVAVSTTLAAGVGNVRHWLSATQLGSALISSFTDPITLAMISRFDGLPVMNVVRRAVKMAGEKGAEVFAAQQGLVLDALALTGHSTDRVLGETIRTGIAAKLNAANIRVSGLRRWTAILRSAFALEMMAHAARQRDKLYRELGSQFRETLARYGIGPGEWDKMRAVTPHEPRPNATFTRAIDIDLAGHADVASRWSRLVNTEMDYAVIEGDPLTRALLLGSSRPGTLGGEVRRSIKMYRAFPATYVTMHFARALARGWDGRRLGHAAMTFALMTVFGALAMQVKEIAAGRDPLNMNPAEANGLRAWGKAILQGGGMGVFGDVMYVDQTKYGNTWAATLAGPVAGAVETVLGDFLTKNIQQAGKGQETHFLGDALYALGRHTPGSSLWFARLAFQREVLDQLALMVDPKARERFARMEETARREWGQSYWWQPGRSGAARAPELGAIFGR
jgi:hypothetical protein